MRKGPVALVTWLERTADGLSGVRLREVAPTGASAPIAIATASNGRATGIAMMARAGDDVIVAWRQGQVRTARVPIPTSATARR